jgi:ribosomal protein S12 methylthiotransferase
LEREIPEVDAYFGTMELPALLEKLEADYKQDLIGERMLLTPPHYAYLKISEGCNRTCSFCAIPLMRGKHISRTIESLVAETKNLAKNGVKEIMLIAQELTYYGLDIYKKRALSELLEALNGVEGIEWIRLHYAYPSKFPTEVLDSIQALPKVCKYLDMPLQHISDNVLKNMRRQISKAETTDLIRIAREKVPGIALRTTFLVGFPGETEEDFQELLSFVKAMRFERVGVFQYSHEENTSAHEMEDDVPAEIKEERTNRLMELQREISAELNQDKIGNKMRVLIDRKESGYFVGRSEFDSPEVDNEVLIEAKKDTYLRIGDFANVSIIDSTEYDLFAELIK